MIGDPTLYVMNKMQEVFKELNVTVERYDLYEVKNNITALPQTLKDADGVILATTVEWYGIGGLMQQFLDACWLYGDKERISKIYMCPVVMSTAYGEREGMMNLNVAWEILGGLLCTGICGFVADTAEFEQNKQYARLIEKKAEDLYRSVNQKAVVLPCSNQAVKQKVSFTQSLNLTPQEAEQLSELASDDDYVQKQKEDIQELASMFKGLMGEAEIEENDMFVNELKSHFHPQPGFRAVYRFHIPEAAKPLVVQVDNGQLQSFYGNVEQADVEMQIAAEVMREIVEGRMTFQRAFMAGSMKMKGDFKVLRTLDILFHFQ